MPSRIARGGLTRPGPAVSDMPHISATGMPSRPKYSSTGAETGAAPPASQRSAPRPSFSRSPARSSIVSAPGSSTPRRTSAARSFSSTRGTPPQSVGRTSGSTASTWRGSATHVTVQPSPSEPW